MKILISSWESRSLSESSISSFIYLRGGFPLGSHRFFFNKIQYTKQTNNLRIHILKIIIRELLHISIKFQKRFFFGFFLFENCLDAWVLNKLLNYFYDIIKAYIPGAVYMFFSNIPNGFRNILCNNVSGTLIIVDTAQIKQLLYTCAFFIDSTAA